MNFFNHRQSLLPHANAPNRMSEDGQWTCYKCFINNFNGRSNCFKCGTLRVSGEALALDAKGLSMVGALPCDTLLLRELPLTADEASIHQTVVRTSGIEPLCVRLAASRMFAFVQMESLADAEKAHQKMQRLCLYIDNCAVFVSFSRHSLDTVLSDGRIELLPGNPQGVFENSRKSLGSATVNTPFGVLPTFPAPDLTQLQYEPSSGYYYDKTTGFYFDPKAEFFYSPKSKSWKFWCQKYRTYIDCEGGDLELKRRLQEDERRHQSRRSDEQTVDGGPPSEAEHRSALRNAPPPPSTRVGSGTTALASTTSAQADKTALPTKSNSDTSRRPLLLDLDNDDEDHDTGGGQPMRSIGREEHQDGRKRRTSDIGGDNGHGRHQRRSMNYKNARHEKIVTLDDANTAPPLSSNSALPSAAGGKSSTDLLMGTLRESMRLNHVVIAQLNDQLAMAKSRHQIASLQSQIDALLSQQRSLEASINELIRAESCRAIGADAATAGEQHRRPDSVHSVRDIRNNVELGPPAERSEHRVMPQLKRHITSNKKQISAMEQRSPSIVELDDQQEEDAAPIGQQLSAKRPMLSPSPTNLLSWRDNTNQQQSMFNREEQQRHRHLNPEFHDSPTVSREDLGHLVSAMVKRGIDEEWRKRRSRSRSQSLRRDSRRDEQWRDGSENARRSRHSDERRSRSRDRSRDSRQPRGSRHRQSLHGQEPMTMASPSPPPVNFIGESWIPPSNDRVFHPSLAESAHSTRPPFPFGPLVGVPIMPPEHMHPILRPYLPHQGNPYSQGPNSLPRFDAQTPPMSRTLSMEPRFGFNRTSAMQMNIPGVPPGYMAPPSNSRQFFADPLRDQQLHYPAALSLAAARIMPPAAFASSAGVSNNRNTAVVNQLDTNKQREKFVLASKERDKVNSLGICFNCGRHGHSLFQCRFDRISDDQLQKKLRETKLKLQRQEIDKQGMKLKAEKHVLRRNDPLVERLRVVAPQGKIKLQHIRVLCPKCAHFNHTHMQCSRPAIGRTMHKQICTALDEFKKVFFVHLQEDIVIDFSEKFEIFRVMDGIVQSGTMDPVGLQLHGMCPDGIVTQMDLRELCSNCAQLGHKRTECSEKTECSRTHYAKMLTLVKAYRVLVKEGNGNFLLPRTNMNPQALVLKDIERSEPIEEIILLEDTSDEEDNNNNNNAVQKVVEKEKTAMDKKKEEQQQQQQQQTKDVEGKEGGVTAEKQNDAEQNGASSVVQQQMASVDSAYSTDDQHTAIAECIENLLRETSSLNAPVADEVEEDDEVVLVEEEAEGEPERKKQKKDGDVKNGQGMEEEEKQNGQGMEEEEEQTFLQANDG